MAQSLPWSLTMLVVASLVANTACKKESPPKAPAPQGARDGGVDPDDDAPANGEGRDNEDADSEDGAGEDDENDGTEALKLSIVPESLAALKIAGDTPASIRFTLSGDTGKDVIIGLSEAPAGVTLAKSGSTVTFGWVSPLKGNHPLRFILRDRDLCEAAEDDPRACDIEPADFGKIGAKSYDVTSDRFTLDVATGSGPGGPGGGNDSLIAQIIDLLGGNASLKDFLSGLSTTQLNQILGLAQAGLDLNTITALLGL